MRDFTLQCELELNKLTLEQKNELYSEVGAISHAITYSSPDSKKQILNIGYKKLCKSLSAKCPELKELDVRLIAAILLNCTDELILSRAAVIDRVLPELMEVSSDVRAAKHRRQLLEAEERHQQEIDNIEMELRSNDWKDSNTGTIEKKLTMMVAVTRARYTPIAAKSIEYPSEKVTKYGNHKKYQKYIIPMIDTN